MKRTHDKEAYTKWFSMALILSLLISLVGCGGATSENAKGADKLINHVEVMIPNPTAPEAMVSLQGKIALQYYLEARMYLEKLSMINAEEIDQAELLSLLNDTIRAFENAEKMSSFLSSSVDLWMKTDDKREAPTVKVVHKVDAAEETSLLHLFALNSYAAGNSMSEMSAQAIVNVFDKAENGYKLRTLAELLGTDARHAMEQLKIAQATLEGADAMAVAERATTCIKVAKTLKTAGTAAGLLIAAAPLATGSVASMATGEMIATTGGVVMGGVNTTLEMTSTGATLYYGTDENKITSVADAVADSKIMKTINMVVGAVGSGYNVKNVIQKMDSVMKQPQLMNPDELLSMSANNGKESSDLFGVLAFTLENSEPTTPYLMSFMTGYTEEGMKIVLKDTKIGTSPEQQEAMKAVLKETGFSDQDAEAAVTGAVKIIEEGGKTEAKMGAEAEFSPEFVNSFLKDNEWISPSSEFDPDTYIAEKQKFMESLAKAHPTEAPEDEGQNAEASAKEEQGANDDTSGGEIPGKDEIWGIYDCKVFTNEVYQGDSVIKCVDGGDGNLLFFLEEETDNSAIRAASYDAATATALGSYHQGNEEYSYDGSVKIVFHKQGGRVMMDMYMNLRTDQDIEFTSSVSGVKR